MASHEYEVVQDVCHHGGTRQHETVFEDDDGAQVVEITVDDDRLSSAVIRDDVDVSSVDHHPPLIVFHELEDGAEDHVQYGVGSEDIVLQPAEEVVDEGGRFVVDYTDDDVDLNGGLGSCITVGDQPDIGGVLEVLAEDDDNVYRGVDVESVDVVIPTSPSPTRQTHRGGSRSRNRRGGAVRSRGTSMAHRGAGDAVMPFLGGRQARGRAVMAGQPQWRRKQVQVKTVDGEFSVTMWAAAENNAGQFFYSV